MKWVREKGERKHQDRWTEAEFKLLRGQAKISLNKKSLYKVLKNVLIEMESKNKKKKINVKVCNILKY